MAIGDVTAVEGVPDLYLVDTGIFDVPAYGAVYLLDADPPAIIDTGIGRHPGRILDGLDAVGIPPATVGVIAPTHVHLDHAGGTGALAAACPDAEVMVHRIGAPHLVDPTRLIEGTKRAVGDQWEFYGDPEPVPEHRIRALADGDHIDLGDRRLDVHHAPGHAPHQVVLHDPDHRVVFTADAAGVYVPQRDVVRRVTPPPNFDLDQCLADVDTIRGLDPSVLCYAHFGPAPTADRLDRYERELVDWVATVEAAYRDLGDVDAVVDRLRDADDIAAVWGERRATGDAYTNVRGVLHALDLADT